MKKWTLTRIIATCGCILAAAALSVFLILASDRTEEAPAADAALRYENARMITPRTFSSYGELMFAYVGENNYLYNLDDESAPLVYQPVKELLYASDDSVLYTAACELDADHPGRESVIQELQIGGKENRLNTIARVTIDPCWSSNDEVIYYTEDSNRKQLHTFEPLTSTSEAAAEFEQEIVCLRISSDGLLVTLTDGEEYLYVPLSKQLTKTGIQTRGSIITVCEQYDLLLSADGNLFYHWQGADETVHISDNVLTGISHQDNEIYYIRKTDSGAELMCYTVSEEQNQSLAVLGGGILPQLTSDADHAFVLTQQGIVYRYDIQENTLIPYHFIDMDTIRAPMISLFDYRLMVYDLAREQDASFCYAVPSGTALTTEETEEMTERAKELTAEAVDTESYLSMGSTGVKVTELQNMLCSHGYLQCEPTGIFGAETLAAVTAAQEDLNLPDSGYADQMLQSSLAASDVSDRIQPLQVGEQGIRARNLRSRLITLGYLLQSGPESSGQTLRKGMERYCDQNGLLFEDGITEEMQESVLAKDAAAYSGYYELREGDIGNACSELNARLYALGYSEYYSRPVIDAHTVNAVKLFAGVNGMTAGEVITPELLTGIFAEDAAPCPSESAPAGLSEEASATIGQVITDRELKILRKWLTKSFAVNHTDRQAVKRLQVRLSRLGYLAEEDISMIFDGKTAEAIRRFQTEHELTADGIPSKKTLMVVFGIHNSTLSGEE